MPQPSAQQKQPAKTLNTSPTPGLLQRLFGSQQMSPDIEEGIRIARGEMPDLAPVKPYGPLSRLAMANAQAYASPGQTIYLNTPSLEGFSPQEIADTLTHEQTHINQTRQRGYGPTRELLHTIFGGSEGEEYGRRPDEMEAYDAEAKRTARMGRMPGPRPSFLNPGVYTMSQGDIQLPSTPEKGVKVGPTTGMLKKLQVKNASK